MNLGLAIGILTLALCIGCSEKKDTSAKTQKHTDSYSEVADFNGDSAYRHIAAQVEMGPRVPGSDAHSECRQYIENMLRHYGADTVISQTFTTKAFTGDMLTLTNITGKINNKADRRILLAAHWDTRPWAEHDSNSDARQRPIPGANDGGSGVGVLLELARVLKSAPADIGIDLVFFDGEDYGNSSTWGNSDETWCLGSQYWADNNSYTEATRPAYGIVLDMVGGKNAKFHREVSSNVNAPEIVDKVWDIARRSGKGGTFVNSLGGNIIDDHLQLNRAGIPSIVIIESNNPRTRSFNPTWHTQSDDLSNIDRKSLKNVGQTILNLIYEESARNN